MSERLRTRGHSSGEQDPTALAAFLAWPAPGREGLGRKGRSGAGRAGEASECAGSSRSTLGGWLSPLVSLSICGLLGAVSFLLQFPGVATAWRVGGRLLLFCHLP